MAQAYLIIYDLAEGEQNYREFESEVTQLSTSWVRLQDSALGVRSHSKAADICADFSKKYPNSKIAVIPLTEHSFFRGLSAEARKWLHNHAPQVRNSENWQGISSNFERYRRLF